MLEICSCSLCQELTISNSNSGFIRQNDDGELPLHLLLQQSNGFELLMALLKTLPKRCIVDTERETSIIHESCSQLLPNSILRWILGSYPETSLLRNCNGDTLAHVICCHGDSTLPMVQTLNYHCPRLFSIQDNDGNLPLHLVNSEKHSVDIIRMLLDIYPQGIAVRNNKMQTPFSSQLIRRSPEKIRALLLYSDSQITGSILSSMNSSGMLVPEEIFYHLQLDLSALCNSLQKQTTEENFHSQYCSNSIFEKTVYIYKLQT